MSSSSEEDLLFLYALAAEEEEQKRKTPSKKWISDLNEKRPQLGEFQHLFPNLRKDRRKFYEYFRLSEEKFFELLELLDPVIRREDTRFRKAVKSEERLAVCLRFLATGGTFSTIAFSYRLGETTVRRIVYDTCDAIWKVLGPIVMPKPNRKMWERIEEEFYRKYNFPNCLGAIAGRHVILQKPRKSGSFIYRDLSVNLLAVVDANHKFTIVNVEPFGENGDRGIFSQSSFGQRFLKGQLDLPPDKAPPGTSKVMPHVIVGDEAFPLNRNMLRPYPVKQTIAHADKKVYNQKLSRIKSVCEDALGILSRKFRIYQNRSEITSEHMDIIVLATCCLHNFLRNDSQALFEEICENEELGNCALENITGMGGSFSGSALSTREMFTNYFSTQDGLL